MKIIFQIIYHSSNYNNRNILIYSQFEHIIKELVRRHKCLLREKCFLCGIFCTTDKNMHRIKENIVSKNIKSRLHCILK